MKSVVLNALNLGGHSWSMSAFIGTSSRRFSLYREETAHAGITINCHENFSGQLNRSSVTEAENVKNQYILKILILKFMKLTCQN